MFQNTFKMKKTWGYERHKTDKSGKWKRHVKLRC